MKTTITITGQIGGNYTLKSAISKTGNPEIIKGEFSMFYLIYPTKKEAKKALWEAYKELKEPGDRITRYSKHGFLNYDASSAMIGKFEN